MTRHVRRIDHVGVLVRSVDEALRYFVDVLGLTLEADEVRPDGTCRLAYLRAGDTTLQLVQPLIDGENANLLRANGEGLHHICFEVDDLQNTLNDLPAEEAQTIEAGGRNRPVVFLAHRPCGVLTELIR